MAKLGQYGHQLHTMTAQEVLDVGVGHLLTQMEKSEDAQNCNYDGGHVCCGAAPFLREYEKALDDVGYDWLGVLGRGNASSNHKDLISGLQSVHDQYYVEDWPPALRELATKEKLVYNGEQYE
tara:strand:+ start:311 stop:679 length:369 start_codon:yes stop_codon:yes gene_type:complete